MRSEPQPALVLAAPLLAVDDSLEMAVENVLEITAHFFA
jgi:hypothetical protein